MIFACPVCQEILLRDDRQIACVNGHYYDLAKEGYANLLLANQKNSLDPGDSKPMIQARRLFLEGGYYQPLVKALARLLPESSKDSVMLDVGCGEGYYIGQMDCSQRYGLDISKIAIRYAAKRYKNVLFAVGSAMNLPVLNESVDILMNIFAPLYIEDAVRVLKAGGLLVKVRPAENHLLELKELLYDTPQSHDISELLLHENLQHVEGKQVRYKVNIVSSAHIQALFQMTPYYWYASPEQQSRVNALQELAVTSDFWIDVYQAKK